VSRHRASGQPSRCSAIPMRLKAAFYPNRPTLPSVRLPAVPRFHSSPPLARAERLGGRQLAVSQSRSDSVSCASGEKVFRAPLGAPLAVR
jgi:hypothetical protein